MVLSEVSAEMDETARWRPLRNVGDEETPENLRALIKIADGSDVEVACEAFSHLSDYSPTPELNEFLARKMKDPNPKIALKAAIITCYSGDWSGFEMLVKHISHDDADLR